MDSIVLIIFSVVYVGMILGGIPGLAMDRTGVALLGAIALLACGRMTSDAFFKAVDTPTLGLLLGLMVVSAQFRMSGFYAHLVRLMGRITASPPLLLAVLILATGLLSALLVNDIICLAAAPVLVEICVRRGLNAKPFLLALACASNVGSAATLIGNPQNMLIGQVLGLSFSKYIVDAGVPSMAGLVVVWAVIATMYRKRWREDPITLKVEPVRFNGWQTFKGSVVLVTIVLLFLFTPFKREIVALTAAGVLLCSRRLRSREMLGLVDWQLLILFISLFVVNYAMRESGNLDVVKHAVMSNGVRIESPWCLFGLSVLLSNLVSNVPATMLLLPSATHPMAGPVLALSSTLAGNLLVVGSIANIIVIDQASRLGVRITWVEHLRVGVPVTIFTLGLAAAWLWYLV